MGRTRKREKHLPRRMYLWHGAYRFIPKVGKPIWLGPASNLGAALEKYAKLAGPSFSVRNLGDVIDKYRIQVLPLKRAKQTRDEEGKSLDRLKKAFGHFLPDNLTAQHCYAYMDARRGRAGQPVPTAARHEIVLLGHVYKKAIRWGAASMNPVRGLELPKRKGKRRQVLMSEVAAVKALANQRMAAAIDLAVSIGQRRGDLLALKHKDLDGELHIEQSKTGAAIDMARSADLDAIVARLKAFKPDIPNEYLIRKRNGKRYTTSGFYQIWRRVMLKHVAGGGQHFTFHDLRSVSADGADTVEEAQKRLGHASPDTTRRFYWKNVTKAKPRS